MSVRLVAYAVVWLILLQVAVQFSSIWSGERLHHVVRRVRGRTPLGDQVFLAFLRGFLPLMVGLAVLMVAVTIAEVAMMTGGPGQPVITSGLLWLGMSLLGIGLVVGALGRPRFIIPPSIRGCRTVNEVLGRTTDSTD